MTAVLAAAEATGLWATANRVLAELMFWRPLPGFQPSDEAFAPSRELYELLRAALAGAVEAGELGPAAATDRGIDMFSCLVGGVMSQHLANEPGPAGGQGRFTPLLAQVVALLPHAFPPHDATALKATAPTSRPPRRRCDIGAVGLCEPGPWRPGRRTP